MFKGRSATLDWIPQEGDQVEVQAVVTLYEPRGDFQLRVESMARAGQGALYEAFLARKARLSSEGLLEPGRKRPLPVDITTVGLVTSLSAAALRDVVVTLTHLAPRIRIRVYPSPVQGVDAPAQLIRCLQQADADPANDVIVMVRGGGSLEDLWAFNDEDLAREIARTRHPVIVGVGHETDVTLADLVADLRAATPTGAAQAIAERDQALRVQLTALAMRARVLMGNRWSRAQQQLDLVSQGLKSPRQAWQQRQHRLERLGVALASQVSRQLAQARLKLSTLSASLKALDPTAILDRGYALVLDPQGRVVTSAAGVEQGDSLKIRLAKGLLDVRVEGAHPERDAG